MNKYYLISAKNSVEVPSAFPKNDVKMSHELIPELEGINEMPFELYTTKLSVGKDGLIEDNDISSLNNVWLDYLPNRFAWPLFSERFKLLIDAFLTKHENVDWISAKVNANNEQRVYYIPRFNKLNDVLDFEKTLFVANTRSIIIPCLSLQKIKHLAMTTIPVAYDLWKITSSIYVSEAIKKAIQKEKLTGVVFEKVKVE